MRYQTSVSNQRPPSALSSATWRRDRPAREGLPPGRVARGGEFRDRAAKIEALLDLVTDLIREKARR